MASLHKHILIAVDPAAAWDAIRDVGALHTRLVPGFVVDTRLEGDTRIVTFGNGMVVREPILSNDDARRRVAWTSEGGRLSHYNAVMTVVADGAGCRVTWTSDLLPNEMADAIGAMQEQGLAIMKAHLEKSR